MRAFLSACLRRACVIVPVVTGGAGQALAELKNENLLAPLPEGFKVGYQARKGAMDIFEYVPRGETVEDWSRMVTVQIFHTLPDADPGVFADRVARGWTSSCPGATAAKATDGMENGYRFTLWIFGCPSNPGTGKPESMALKAIGGADGLYSVQYAYRQNLSKETLAPAVQYLRQAKVCDTRRAGSACPSK